MKGWYSVLPTGRDGENTDLVTGSETQGLSGIWHHCFGA